VVGARPGRRDTADRLVVIKRRLEHTFAPGQRRETLLDLMYAGGGQLALHDAGLPVGHGRERQRAEPNHCGHYQSDQVGRDVKAEPVYGLAHGGAGLDQGGHQHKRRQVAEVAGVLDMLASNVPCE
jgi:hypothetical protein